MTVVPIPLKEDFLHLDCVFNMISETEALYCKNQPGVNGAVCDQDVAAFNVRFFQSRIGDFLIVKHRIA
jgi:N-dimethylarginine dimethylaminohydrolase